MGSLMQEEGGMTMPLTILIPRRILRLQEWEVEVA